MIPPLKFSRHAAWKRPHSTAVSYTRPNSTRHLFVHHPVPPPLSHRLVPRLATNSRRIKYIRRNELNCAHVPRHASTTRTPGYPVPPSWVEGASGERGRVYRESNRNGSHPRGTTTVFIYRGAYRGERFKREGGEEQKDRRRPPIRDEKPVLVVPVVRRDPIDLSFSRPCRISYGIYVYINIYIYILDLPARPVSLNGDAKVNGSRKGRPVTAFHLFDRIVKSRFDRLGVRSIRRWTVRL